MKDDNIFFAVDEDEDDLQPVDVDAIRDSLLERGEFKCHATLKASDDDKRIVEGYANTKNIDRMGDIVDPGAFKGTLKQWMKNPIILADHWASVENVIGKGLEATIDNKGLKLKAQIAEGTRLADETWALIQQKMVRAFSIGFRILKDEMIDAPGKAAGMKIRKITKLELYEVSVVAIPANAESLFSVGKGIMHGTDLFAPVHEGRVIAPTLEETNTEDEYPEAVALAKEIKSDLDRDLAEAEIRNWNKEIKRGS